MRLSMISLAAVASCSLACAPGDRLLSYNFALNPVQGMRLPDATVLGTDLTPLDFAQAVGRCSGDSRTDQFSLHVTGLPPLPWTRTVASYQLVLVTHVEAGHADNSVLRRLLEVLSPLPEAHAHGSGSATTVRLELGHLRPNELGLVHESLTADTFRVDQVAGASIELTVPTGDGAAEDFPVMSGELGNLEDAAAPSTISVTAGGHQH